MTRAARPRARALRRASRSTTSSASTRTSSTTCSTAPATLPTPRALHPAFYGSYDWHSCVHMHWLLATLRRRVPGAAAAARRSPRCSIATSRRRRSRARSRYLARPATQSFERTYGWAWLLKLAARARTRATATRTRTLVGGARAARATRSSRATARYLPRAQLSDAPRHHPNSAFGLAFALDYARCATARRLAARASPKARRWYGGDRDAPGRVGAFGRGFPVAGAGRGRPDAARAATAPRSPRWLDALPAGSRARRSRRRCSRRCRSSDRSDPQIVHLDGLNLSRAWCFARHRRARCRRRSARRRGWRRPPPAPPRRRLDGLASDDYMGAHWLASFAPLALAGGGAGRSRRLATP